MSFKIIEIRSDRVLIEVNGRFEERPIFTIEQQREEQMNKTFETLGLTKQ